MKKILLLAMLTSSLYSQNWWTSQDSGSIYAKNTGSVLVGSFTPLGKLTVGPDDRFYNLSLVGDYNNMAKNYLQVGVTGRGFGNLQGQIIFDLIHSNNQNRLAGYNFRVSGTSRMFLSGEGYLGLGTEKPAALLELNGGPDWSGFKKALRLPPGHAIEFDASPHHFGLAAYSNELTLVVSNPTSGPFGSAFSRVMTIQPKKIIIEGDLEVKGRISEGGTTFQMTDYVATGGGTTGTIPDLAGLSQTNGNFGIGASPINKLDIAGGVAIGTSYAGNLVAPTNGAFIEGNVVIGATSPDPEYKLTVKGKIKAEELRLTTKNWPDYVFASGYQLRPLSEVERHIKRFNHLPDVPSEAQVLEEGVGVIEMQAKLLQKIEELTLYVIELEKKVDHQRLEIESADPQK
ncbi:MAG: hypothetical protein KDC99_19525 [Cyclobacteriaceae bacterium]|nr:hypothetical protein [Cyclobacteriaceae bacterium]